MYLSESVQFKSLSCVWLFVTPWTAVRQASLSITSSQSLLKLKSIKSVMPPTISSSVVPSPTFNLSQHQGLFQWISSSYQVDKVLEFHLQHQSFQWIFRLISLGWTGWISLQSKGLSRVFYNTTVQKHQFFSTGATLRRYPLSKGKRKAPERQFWNCFYNQTPHLPEMLRRLK